MIKISMPDLEELGRQIIENGSKEIVKEKLKDAKCPNGHNPIYNSIDFPEGLSDGLNSANISPCCEDGRKEIEAALK